jgi:hypothetical protein
MNLVMPALSRPSMMFWASGRRMGSHIDCRSSARYICRCANTKNNGITGRQSVDDPLAGQYQKPITLYPIPCPTPPMCKCCALKYTLYMQMCKYQQHCTKLRYTDRSSDDNRLGGQYQKPITLYPIPCPTPPMCKCCAVKYTLYTQMCKYQQHCTKLRYTGRSCWGAEASPPPQGNRSIGATHHYLDDQR